MEDNVGILCQIDKRFTGLDETIRQGDLDKDNQPMIESILKSFLTEFGKATQINNQYLTQNKKSHPTYEHITKIAGNIMSAFYRLTKKREISVIEDRFANQKELADKFLPERCQLHSLNKFPEFVYIPKKQDWIRYHLN